MGSIDRFHVIDLLDWSVEETGETGDVSPNTDRDRCSAALCCAAPSLAY
jgi:hypothetical protein